MTLAAAIVIAACWLLLLCWGDGFLSMPQWLRVLLMLGFAASVFVLGVMG